jgi:hypothetical protein
MEAMAQHSDRPRFPDRDRLVEQGQRLVIDAMRLIELVIRRADEALQSRIALHMASSNLTADAVEKETLARIAAGETLTGEDPRELLERWNKQHIA